MPVPLPPPVPDRHRRPHHVHPTQPRREPYRPAGPPPAPIRNSAQAMHLLSLAIARPLQPETLCFPLDPDGRGAVITVVSGTERPDAVLDVVEFMCQAVDGTTLTSLVAATVRPRGGLLPGDLDRWLEASAIASDHGVMLLEWYVIGLLEVATPRDLLGEPERWPHPGRSS